jgi:hypothetical protein
MKKYTDKQIKDAIDAVTSGMTLKEAGQFAGVPIHIAQYYSERNKSALRGNTTGSDSSEIRVSFTKKYTDKQREDALAAVKAGKSQKEAAKIAGVPKHMVYWWKRMAGLTPSGPRIRLKKVEAQVRGEGVRLEQGTIQAIVNQVIKYFEAKPQNEPIAATYLAQLSIRNPQTIELIRAEVVKVIAATPIKLSTEDFMQMLRHLISENTQTKEELARLRKSNSDWQIRAGRALEQAQQAINQGR